VKTARAVLADDKNQIFQSKHASNGIQWQQKWRPDYSIEPGFAHAGTEHLDQIKREEQVTLLKVKTISPLKTNKFTPDSRRSPSSLPLLIIGIKISSWLTLSKLRSANENRRSGKEPHPSRVLFIGRNKRLKDYYALGPNTKK
jgi:hypothetical protein